MHSRRHPPSSPAPAAGPSSHPQTNYDSRPIPQPYLATAPAPISATPASALDSMILPSSYLRQTRAGSSSAVYHDHADGNAQDDDERLAGAERTGDGRRQKRDTRYATGLLSPPAIIPSGRIPPATVQRLAPHGAHGKAKNKGVRRKRQIPNTAGIIGSGVGVGVGPSSAARHTGQGRQRGLEGPANNASQTSLGHLAQILGSDPGEMHSGQEQHDDQQQPQARRRRRIVRGDGDDVPRRRVTVSSREEGRAMGVARGASMRRRNVWDDIPDSSTQETGEPPPPFPFPTSSSRGPPAFPPSRAPSESVEGGRRSPPPSWEVAVGLASSPAGAAVVGPVQVTRLAIPATASRASSRTRSRSPAGTAASTLSPTSSAYVSAPNSPLLTSAPLPPAQPPHTPSDLLGMPIVSVIPPIAEDDEEQDVDEGESREDRYAWNTDLLAGYSLEERVQREFERRIARVGVRAQAAELSERVVDDGAGVGFVACLEEGNLASLSENAADENTAGENTAENERRTERVSSAASVPLSPTTLQPAAMSSETEHGGVSSPAQVELSTPGIPNMASQELASPDPGPEPDPDPDPEPEHELADDTNRSREDDKGVLHLDQPVNDRDDNFDQVDHRVENVSMPARPLFRSVPWSSSSNLHANVSASAPAPASTSISAQPLGSPTDPDSFDVPSHAPLSETIQRQSIPSPPKHHPEPNPDVTSAETLGGAESGSTKENVKLPPSRESALRRRESRLTKSFFRPPLMPGDRGTKQRDMTLVAGPLISLIDEETLPDKKEREDVGLAWLAASSADLLELLENGESSGINTLQLEKAKSEGDGKDVHAERSEGDDSDGVAPAATDGQARIPSTSTRPPVPPSPSPRKKAPPPPPPPRARWSAVQPPSPIVPLSPMWRVDKGKGEEESQATIESEDLPFPKRRPPPPPPPPKPKDGAAPRQPPPLPPRPPPAAMKSQTPDSGKTFPVHHLAVPEVPLPVVSETSGRRQEEEGETGIAGVGFGVKRKPGGPRPPPPPRPRPREGWKPVPPAPPPPRSAPVLRLRPEESVAIPGQTSSPTETSPVPTVTSALISTPQPVGSRPAIVGARPARPTPPRRPLSERASTDFPPLRGLTALVDQQHVRNDREAREEQSDNRWASAVDLRRNMDLGGSLSAEGVTGSAGQGIERPDVGYAERRRDSEMISVGTGVHSPGGEGEREYTDVDLFVSQLEGTGREYEGYSQLASFLGPSKPPAASAAAITTLLPGLISVDSRRTTPQGKVKLKLSLLGVRVTKCPICQSQFRGGEKAILTPMCGHAGHEGCVKRWFREDGRCFICREVLKEE